MVFALESFGRRICSVTLRQGDREYRLWDIRSTTWAATEITWAAGRGFDPWAAERMSFSPCKTAIYRVKTWLGKSFPKMPCKIVGVHYIHNNVTAFYASKRPPRKEKPFQICQLCSKCKWNLVAVEAFGVGMPVPVSIRSVKRLALVTNSTVLEAKS